jgi:plastocyanin
MKKLFSSLIAVIMVLVTAITMGQSSYLEAYVANSGNPGGLNTETDTYTTGWTQIMAGSQASNVWTPVQTIPFTFEFFGTAVTQYKVSQNGIITFDPAAASPPPGANEALPSALLPNLSICMFWDAFTTSPPTGSNDYIYTKVFGTAPNRQLWIRYYSFEYSGFSFAYWEAVLEETTNKVYIVDQDYWSGSGSATVGLQENTTNYVMATGSPSIAFATGSTGYADNDYYEYTPTVPGAPLPPFEPYPDNGALGLPTAGNCTWTFGANTETYDLWFGPAGSMVKVVDNQSAGATGIYPYSGLSNGAVYEWQVIARNSTKLETNGPVWSFTTVCALVTLPISEGFNAAIAPPCWDTYLIADPGTDPTLTFETAGTYPTCGPYEGTHMVKFNSFNCSSGASMRLQSLPFETTGISGVSVKFKWYESTNYPTYLTEGVWVQYTLDNATWNDVAFFQRVGTVNQWTDKLASLPPAVDNQAFVRIGFRFVSQYGYNCFLDLVEVEQQLAPLPPFNPVPANLAIDVPVSGNLTWDFGSNTDTYDLWFGPTGSMLKVVDNQPAGPSGVYPYSGLSNSTGYEWQVIARNSAKAETAGPVWSFTTVCGLASIPWSEGFNAATMPDCWNSVILADPGTDPTITFETAGTYPTCSPYEGTHMVKFNSFNCPSGASIRLQSLPFSSTGVYGYGLRFKWYQDPGYATYLNEGVWIQYTLDNVTWTDIAFYQRYSATAGWTEQMVPLPAVADNQPFVRIGFRFYSQYGNNCYMDLAEAMLFQFGNLTGVVRDAASVPIAGAVVECGTYASTPTGGDGIYTITGILYNTYDVTCTAPGYNDYSYTGLVIDQATTVHDIYMTAPTMTVTPPVISKYIAAGLTGTSQMVVTNGGNGPLNWSGNLQSVPKDASLSFEGISEVPVVGPDAEASPTGTAVTGYIDDKAMWDVSFSWGASAGAQPGIETDGTYIYTATWSASFAPPWFHKYTMGGTLVEEFDITGATAIRDMAFDGTYFYGGAASTTIYVMDFTNKVLIGTIPVTGFNVRHIAYDPTANGGAGGLWCGDWASLNLVSMTGATLASAAISLAAMYGTAYDPVTAGGPYLWIFDQGAGAGTTQLIHQFSIASMSLTGVSHNVADIPGFDVAAGIAGGLCLGINPTTESTVLIGSVQQTPNLVFGYVLKDGWVDYTPKGGTVLPGKASQNLDVNFNTLSYPAGTIKTAYAHFWSDPDVGQQSVQLNMYVCAAATTWTGVISEDWFNPGNWTDGVPGVGTDVLVPSGCPNYPTLNGWGDCDNITFQSNAAGTATILDNGFLTIGGVATVERYYAEDEWHLVSSPIADAYAGMYVGMYLQKYQEPLGTWVDIVPLNHPLQPMRGYALWIPPSTTLTATYAGTLNMGPQYYYMTASQPYGWNLLGNPYLSSIDCDMVSIPPYMNAAVYYLDAATGNYLSYVGGGGGGRYIPPMQGFFVSALGPGPVTVNDAVRTHVNGSFYYKGGYSNQVVLEATGNGYSDKTYIRFSDESTANFDRLLDAYKLFPFANDKLPQIFTMAGTDNISVNTLPAVEKMTVGFWSETSGTYTIGLAENENFETLILEDLVTGVQTDLLTSSYSFGYNVGDDNSRFLLHFGPVGMGESALAGTSIYSYGKDVYVNVPENTYGSIMVYNMLGQVVTTREINGALNKITLDNAGNYIVKVLGSERTVAQKVFVE